MEDLPENITVTVTKLGHGRIGPKLIKKKKSHYYLKLFMFLFNLFICSVHWISPKFPLQKINK